MHNIEETSKIDALRLLAEHIDKKTRGTSNALSKQVSRLQREPAYFLDFFTNEWPEPKQKKPRYDPEASIGPSKKEGALE